MLREWYLTTMVNFRTKPPIQIKSIILRYAYGRRSEFEQFHCVYGRLCHRRSSNRDRLGTVEVSISQGTFATSADTVLSDGCRSRQNPAEAAIPDFSLSPPRESHRVADRCSTSGILSFVQPSKRSGLRGQLYASHDYPSAAGSQRKGERPAALLPEIDADDRA
jgi:hypothetical protein